MGSDQDRPIKPALYWQDSEGPRQFVLKSGQSIVGRAEDCDLVIRHPSISREHARLVDFQGEYSLIDLGTILGTFVNGFPIQACVLHNGDRVEFGKSNHVMYFWSDEVSEHTSPTGAGNTSPVERELPILEEVSSETASSILHAELRKLRQQRMRFERDFLLAEKVQTALLPKRLPDINGFRLRAYSKPTRHVGGDFYDFVPTSTATICGVLGDVSGKGIAASLLSAMVLGCLDARLRTGSSLEDAVQTANGLLHEKGDGRFVTLFLFDFDANGHGHFVSAGHNPAFLYRHAVGAVEDISANNTIVGPFLPRSFHSASIDLAIGDVMLVYSDGLPDAENVADEMLGDEPLRRLLQRDSPGGVDNVMWSILNLLRTFTARQQQSDDITFMILQRVGAGF